MERGERMRIFHDRQIKIFSFFIALYIILIFGMGIWFYQNQMVVSQSMYLEHNRAIVSSLLNQGVSKEVIANAVFAKEVSSAGIELSQNLGITRNTPGSLLPYFSQFQYDFLLTILGGCICLTIILCAGIIFFLNVRNKLYQQAEMIIDNYINNDYSCHLPQNSEGEIFRLFASIEQLATMLQSQNETEHKT